MGYMFNVVNYCHQPGKGMLLILIDSTYSKADAFERHTVHLYRMGGHDDAAPPHPFRPCLPSMECSSLNDYFASVYRRLDVSFGAWGDEEPGTRHDDVVVDGICVMCPE